MLHRLTHTGGCRVLATDGEIGHVQDVYFDDAHWVIRYLVVNTGGWLDRRNVLISPHAVKLVDPVARTVAVSLDRGRVQTSPNIDTGKPVSRQYEAEYAFYYGYPAYWPASSATYRAAGGVPIVPPVTGPGVSEPALRRSGERSDVNVDVDSHLRSAAEVAGYDIRATDDNVGHVEDFLFDDRTWRIHHIVADTRSWLIGKHVLVSPRWISEIDWPRRAVKVDQSCEQVKQWPEFDPQNLPVVDDSSGDLGADASAGLPPAR